MFLDASSFAMPYAVMEGLPARMSLIAGSTNAANSAAFALMLSAAIDA